MGPGGSAVPAAPADSPSPPVERREGQPRAPLFLSPPPRRRGALVVSLPAPLLRGLHEGPSDAAGLLKLSELTNKGAF